MPRVGEVARRDSAAGGVAADARPDDDRHALPAGARGGVRGGAERRRPGGDPEEGRRQEAMDETGHFTTRKTRTPLRSA
ncbi:hypothetical protein [Aeromicrobium tamlense]|uniref:hypothetical protein n=1 Tax=Aeromicrobium tamlense TaxID=375541 RepID=UPI0015C6EB57|nr:hypothetical protein [Aeromicrobium tamlense]